MKKEIKNYLHLYLGGEIRYKDEDFKLPRELDIESLELIARKNDWLNVRLYLRPIASITYREGQQSAQLSIDLQQKQNTTALHCWAVNTQYFLENGVDLFNLIEDGVAFEKKY